MIKYDFSVIDIYFSVISDIFSVKNAIFHVISFTLLKTITILETFDNLAKSG